MKPLAKKQSMSNDAWIEVIDNIEKVVSKKELNGVVRATISEIKNTAKGKKAAYAWSAGKDSVVLSHICEKAGVKDCMIGVCNLEYPAFADWIDKNKPEKCEVVNTGQDINWLARHQDMLFPQDSRKAAKSRLNFRRTPVRQARTKRKVILNSSRVLML